MESFTVFSDTLEKHTLFSCFTHFYHTYYTERWEANKILNNKILNNKILITEYSHRITKVEKDLQDHQVQLSAGYHPVH